MSWRCLLKAKKCPHRQLKVGSIFHTPKKTGKEGNSNLISEKQRPDFYYYFGVEFFLKKPCFVGGRIAHCGDFRTDTPLPPLFERENCWGSHLGSKKDSMVATYIPAYQKEEPFFIARETRRRSISGLETKISSDSGDLKYDTRADPFKSFQDF